MPVRPALVLLLVLALHAGLLPDARAQGPPAPGAERDVAAVASRELALRRVRAFLADGPGAPRPDLSPLDALELAPSPPHPLLGPCAVVVLRGPGGHLRLLVPVELVGARPVGLLQPERECHVRRLDDARRPRDPAAVAAEAARRCVLDRDALLARAREFLARALEDAPARRLELMQEERSRAGLCSDTFLFVERPREGVALCMENLARVTLQPETGDVVAARWTDVRHERVVAPPCDAARAEAIARAREPGLGARRSAALRLLFRPAGEAGRGDPVAVWGLTFEPATGFEPAAADAALVARFVDADRGVSLE